MQNSMHTLGGLMALTILAACGGDDADLRVAPAAGKAAAGNVAAAAREKARAPAPAPREDPAPAPAPREARPPAPEPREAPAPAPAKSAPLARPRAPAARQPRGDVGSGEMMGKMSGWRELDAFQKVLQDAWYPVAVGDLAPARAKAAAVLAAALVWRSSRGPARCDNAAARGGMASFIEDARSYADAAKRSASDDAIQVTLKRTHDGFEMIAEPCVANR